MPADVSVSKESTGDIKFTITGQGQIYIAREFEGQGVQELTFAGGGTLTEADLQRLADTGSPTNTSLYGTAGADSFDSAGYATYIQGGGGADTFLYKPGYGDLEINEDAGSYNQISSILQFGAGIRSFWRRSNWKLLFQPIRHQSSHVRRWNYAVAGTIASIGACGDTG